MRVSILAIFIVACSSNVRSQPFPAATPAVKKWIIGLDARKNGFDRLRAQLKVFANSPNGNTPGAVPLSIGCPIALESALVDALMDAHVKEGDKEEFHLIIHGQRDGEYLDVSYSYNQRGALLMTAIGKLPTGWIVGFQSGEANVNKFLIVSDDLAGCIFEFDSSDPFASKGLSKQ
jgi:hypothetical protein